MENSIISFESFTTNLIFDTVNQIPVNKEAKSIKIPSVCTKSKNQLVKYLISIAQYFGHYLVVSKSDLITNQYIFKCSVQKCYMKLHYHEINNSKQIKLLKQKSNFQHDTLSHELNPCKIRMLESTYNDFVYCCKKGMKIYDFMLLHPEVNNLNISQLYEIGNKELKN